jgi:hypothetical protein
VHRATWNLVCTGCRREVFPNIVDMIVCYREDQAEEVIRRAVCRDRGARLKHVAGMHVYRLQRGELHTLAVAGGGEFRFESLVLPIGGDAEAKAAEAQRTMGQCSRDGLR